VLFCCVQLASAQSAFDLNIGFGGIHDKASSNQVDQSLAPCTVNDLYPPCVSTPALSGFMLGFGGDLMLWKKFGVGADVAFQPAKENYVNLNSSAALSGLNTLSLQTRVTMYDFDGILQPVNTKKVGVKIRGGIGGANVKFYQSGSSTGTVLGNQNYTQYFASANHFAVNLGVGVQIYLTDHIFVRPEFDYHYVPNMTQQFGSNNVIQGMAWIGYSFGDRP
jgi:hypothetical protein